MASMCWEGIGYTTPKVLYCTVHRYVVNRWMQGASYLIPSLVIAVISTTQEPLVSLRPPARSRACKILGIMDIRKP